MKVDLKGLNWWQIIKGAGSAVVAVAVIGWGGFQAVQNVLDSIRANAQEVEHVREDNLRQWEELMDHDESIDATEEEVEALQRYILEQQGDQRLEIQELRGDIKLILRLLQEDG